MKQVFIPEKIQNAFADCGIEPFAPEGTIEKILSNGNEKKRKKGKELTNEELKKVLAPTVVFQKIEIKKGKKRVQISNKVVTSEAVISELQKKQEEETKKKNKRQKISEKINKNLCYIWPCLLQLTFSPYSIFLQ